MINLSARLARAALVSLLTSAGAAGLAAQSAPSNPVATVRGTLYDSLARRPIAGAIVELSGSYLTALSDSAGRFRLDSVPAGAQRLTFSAPSLDAIGLFAFAHDIVVRPGEQSVALGVPSLATMHTRLCPSTPLARRDSSIVFGTVRDAATGAPVESVTVSFSWFDVRSGGVAATARHARMGADGAYGFCGLPEGIGVATQAASRRAASGRVTTIVGPARVQRRDLLVSTEMIVDSSAVVPGRAILRGTVTQEDGSPVANALVLVAALDIAARTDDAGAFRLTGVPAGTHEVSARMIGLNAAPVTVELRPDRTTDTRITMSRLTTLATVNVRAAARLGDRQSFLDRQRRGVGQFLDEERIQHRTDMGSVLRQLPGLVVSQGGSGLRVYSSRANCMPAVYLDGMFTAPARGSAHSVLELLNPREVVGIEFYPPNAAAQPVQITGTAPHPCGTLLVWTGLSR